MRTKKLTIKIILTSAALAALMILSGRRALAEQATTQSASADTKQPGSTQPAIDKPASGETDLPHAVSFAVTIPPEFMPSDKEGVFIARRYPLDSANITVSIVDLSEEKALTNNEKAAMSERGETRSSLKRLYASLTKDQWTKAAEEMLEEGLELQVDTFEKITLRRPSDGTSFPGYRIVSRMTGARKDITEETRMYVSDDKVFTVTYAWASDDEFEDVFAQSIRSITVY